MDGFSENLIFNTFRKSVEKIQVPSKFDNHNRYFACKFVIISCSGLLRMRNFSGKFVWKLETQILLQQLFSWNSCPVGANVEWCCWAGRATGDNIARRMRFACWIIKATHTHSHINTHMLTICKTYCFCNQLLAEHASILRHMVIAGLHAMLHISNCLLLYIQKNYV